MADQQNASAICVHLPTYYPQYIGLRGNIQHGGCFIQNQQPRLKQQTACNGNPLGFSAGDLMGQVCKNLRLQADLGQNILRQHLFFPPRGKAMIPDQLLKAAPNLLAWI